MATTYQLVDVVLNSGGDSYAVTIKVNKDNAGDMLFTVGVPKPNPAVLGPSEAAHAAVLLLASGTSLATLQAQVFTVA